MRAKGINVGGGISLPKQAFLQLDQSFPGTDGHSLGLNKRKRKLLNGPGRSGAQAAGSTQRVVAQAGASARRGPPLEGANFYHWRRRWMEVDEEENVNVGWANRLFSGLKIGFDVSLFTR